MHLFILVYWTYKQNKRLPKDGFVYGAPPKVVPICFVEDIAMWYALYTHDE